MVLWLSEITRNCSNLNLQISLIHTFKAMLIAFTSLNTTEAIFAICAPGKFCLLFYVIYSVKPGVL